MSSESGISKVRPTRKDVATLAKVSGTTVSRVLGGRADESISEQARERVLQAARELGYTPNSAAKALRSGRSGLIGFWMNLEYSLYRSRVLAEMRRHLRQTEFALAVTDVDEDYAWHQSLDRSLRVPVEGVIAFDASTAAKMFAEESDRLAPNLPFVSMGAFWSEKRSYVGVDLKSGALDAMRHLIESGRRRIAYVVPQRTGFVSSGERWEGYREALHQASLPPQTIEIDDDPERRLDSLKLHLTDCRNHDRLPDALLCFYDDIAMDAITALDQLGLRPGRGVALVGFNGTLGIERGSCPLTTVNQPVEKMCELALKYLQTHIDDPVAPLQQTILKPNLIVRESSRHES
ncbi:MAG: LacI family DNA-binding transcriptional regulator [Armatimonadetes bacterium]|nr:LacI family DNA-binding transcriptional regulator [Armatimonadota bacterium]